MKNMIPAVVITLLLTGTASADQGKGKRGPDLDQLVSSLQLDESTSTNLKALLEKQHAEKRAAREQSKKDREQRQEIRKQQRADVLAVLGYEKMYEYEEYMRANRPKRQKRNK